MTNCDYSCSGFKTADDDLLAFEELLLGSREVQEWPQTSSNNGHKMGGFDGNLKHTAKNDHISTASPRSSEGKI